MAILKRKVKSEYNCEKNNKMVNYEHLNTNYCRSAQVVLAGDSITEILNDNELFYEFKKESGLEVYNRGISGDTSDKLLERFERNVLNIKPSKLVLLIGTNDFAYGIKPEQTVDNINKILELTKNQCPKTDIILQAIYPICTPMQNDKLKNKRLALINRELEALAKKQGVTYLDLSSELSDENGNLKKEFTYDGLHPNVFAFEVTVKKIIELIKEEKK